MAVTLVTNFVGGEIVTLKNKYGAYLYLDEVRWPKSQSFRIFKENQIIVRIMPHTHTIVLKPLFGQYSLGTYGSMTNCPASLRTWHQAHSIGAVGRSGRGVTELLGVPTKEVDVGSLRAWLRC